MEEDVYFEIRKMKSGEYQGNFRHDNNDEMLNVLREVGKTKKEMIKSVLISELGLDDIDDIEKYLEVI